MLVAKGTAGAQPAAIASARTYDNPLLPELTAEAPHVPEGAPEFTGGAVSNLRSAQPSTGEC